MMARRISGRVVLYDRPKNTARGRAQMGVRSPACTAGRAACRCPAAPGRPPPEQLERAEAEPLRSRNFRLAERMRNHASEPPPTVPLCRRYWPGRTWCEKMRRARRPPGSTLRPMPARLPALVHRLTGAHDARTGAPPAHPGGRDDRRTHGQPGRLSRGWRHNTDNLPRRAEPRQLPGRNAQQRKRRLVPARGAHIEEVIAVGLGEIAGQLTGEPRGQVAGGGQEGVRRVEDVRVLRLEPQQLGRDVGRVERVGAQVDQSLRMRPAAQCVSLGLRAAVQPDERGRQRLHLRIDRQQRPTQPIDADACHLLRTGAPLRAPAAWSGTRPATTPRRSPPRPAGCGSGCSRTSRSPRGCLRPSTARSWCSTCRCRW